MRRVLLVFLAIFLGLSVILAISAFGGGLRDRLNRTDAIDESMEEPAVEGFSYFGQFTDSCGQRASSCMAFDRSGNVTWDRDYGSGLPPEVFTGTYTERKLGKSSLWIAAMIDQSPNKSFLLAGLATGNRSTVMLLVNFDDIVTCPDETPLLAAGRYTRTNCEPGQRFGVTVEEGWIGGADTQ
jgi:hypothetical protein